MTEPKLNDPDIGMDQELFTVSALHGDPVEEGKTQRDPEQDTITFKRSHLYATLIPLAFVLGLSVGFLFWGRGSGPDTATLAATSSGQTTAAQVATPESSNPNGGEAGGAVPRYDIPVDDDAELGPADAPITIVEFSDYECPFCQKFHQETFEQLLASYPNQIRFVYRDFPLASIHSNATAAAEAANCALEQNMYWEFHDRLFSGSQGLSRTAYMTYAQELGLEMGAFEECVDSRRYQEEVQADFDFAARLGVRSTPTFFINGLPLVGAQPLPVFQQVIDRELAGEIP